MASFEEFKELVWLECVDAARDAGGTFNNEGKCRRAYERRERGDWHKSLKRNYRRDVDDGKSVFDPDLIHHFQSKYFTCARIAGKRAAMKAAGGRIAVGDFEEAMTYAKVVMIRASGGRILGHLCG